jgi:hypothetical protein
LLAYSPDFVDEHRRPASYFDRFLTGEKTGELPVQTPTKLEFVIDLKAAKSDFGTPFCLHPTVAGSALGSPHFRGHILRSLSLRPGNS